MSELEVVKGKFATVVKKKGGWGSLLLVLIEIKCQGVKMIFRVGI
jgi:hypothetical protein